VPILYAELQVLGRQVPCARASFSFQQTVDEKGRPSSTVRVERLKVVLVGEPAGWGIWEALKFDEFRRVSGWVLFFEGEGQTARRYAFYDAALVWLEFGYDGRGTAGKQAATHVELHFSPATVEVDGQRIEAHSIIPWETDPQTSFRALTKPPDPQPSAHLAALLATVKLKAEQLGAGLLQKVITPAGEVATEFLGVGLAAIGRVASLTLGLLLTPTNSRDDPGYASEWEMYRRNQQHGPPLTPAQLRLAQLERLYEQGALTTEEEAELIALLAKVKGIHVSRLSDLPGPKTNGRVAIPIFTPLLPGEGNVGSYRDLLDAGSRGDNLTPHHVPSDAYIKQHGIAKSEGICINMEQPLNGGRHRRTKTCGRNMTDSEREAYYKLSPKEALEHDIQDARRIFREEGKLDAKMEQKLQEVLDQNKAKFPNLYGR
jgi:hypothetical protein